MRRFGAVFLSAALLAAAAAAQEPSRRERLSWAAEAQRLFHEKKYEPAAARLEMAAAPGASEKDLSAWLPALGRCYEALGNYQKALVAYQRAQQLRPKLVDRLLDLARVYAQVDLHDKAAEFYEAALARDKRRKDALPALAESYLKAERLEKARETAERYLRLEPNDLAAAALLAEAEAALGDLAAAAHRLEGVLAVRPSGSGYFRLGRLWSRQGQAALAERAFDLAERNGFDGAELYIERGAAARRSGDTAAAGKFWARALERRPDSPAAQFLLALNDDRAGRAASAAARFEKLAAGSSSGYVADLAKICLEAKAKSAEREKK